MAALALFAACSDSKVKSPTTSPALPGGPQAAQNEPFNSTGVCLAEDAFLSGAVQGVNDNQDLADPTKNCTANDIRIATADVLEYSFDGTTFLPFDPANPISCTEGDPIFLNLEAHLQETATSERTDIGVWIGLEGGNARTGSCNHYNLVNGVAGVSDIDSDHCGDMVNAATVAVPLGVIDAVCETATPTSTQLHIGSCLGWTQPGGDQVCPQQPSGESPNGYRWGTVPGTTSKCNCEGFDVPITVLKVATIEIKKSCTPASDAGTFDLKIDGSFTDTDGTFGDNVACGGTTGARTVGAGTNVSPGADHTVAEDGFSIAASNYTSTVSCTKNGAAYIASQAYTSPNTLNVHTDPDDAVVCTFVNVRKPSLTIVKRIVNNNGGTAVVGDFGLTTTAGALTFGAGVADGANTLKYTSNTIQLNAAGAFTLHENNVAGYTEGTWSCTAGSVTNTTFNNGSVTLAAGDQAVCTITNDDEGSSLQLVKRIVNDNGGTKVVGDFGITTDAGALVFGAGAADGANTLKYTSNALGVNAGTYSLVESDVGGYTEGTWACTGAAGAVVGTFNAGSVVVGLGETVVCTITNNDQPASLTIVKRIVNDNGGTKVVGDFGITTSAGALVFGAGVADGANTLKYTATTLTGLSAGTKTLVENNVAGYTEGTWACTGNAGAVVGTFNAGSVVLGNGESVTCTITNDDQPATLTIVKVLLGTGTTFSYTTNSGSSGTPLPASFDLVVATDGTNQQVFNNLNAGTYSVTETVPAGYVLTDLTCTGDFSQVYDPTVTQTVSPVLPNGGSVTCTFTNEGAPSETTRTQGFWATHKGLTAAVWFGGTSGGHTFAGVADKNLCDLAGRDIDTIGKLLGGFWSSIPFTSTKTKRSDLDKARMQLLQQLLAAILNHAAFGSSPSGAISIADATAAYCGTNIADILAAQSAMAAFNEGGDSGEFTPGGSANGKEAKNAANLAFWDVLP